MSHPSRSLPHRLPHLPALIMTGFSLLVAANNASAYDYQWIGGDGDWFDAANWTGTGPALLPGENDRVELTFNDATDRLIHFAGPGETPKYGSVYLSNPGAGQLRWAISDGIFHANSVGGGTGIIEQTGGRITAQRVTVPADYHLADGLVDAATVTVGGLGWSGMRQLRIDGGAIHAGRLNLHEGGLIDWTSGQMIISHVLELGHHFWSLAQNPYAEMRFPEQSVSLQLDQTLQIRQGVTIVNGQNVSVELGPNALAILDPGIEPAQLFGSYVNHGLTARIGQPLVVPADRHITIGHLRDTPLHVHGRVTGDKGATAVAELGALHPGAIIEDMGLYMLADRHVVMPDSHLRNVGLGFWMDRADQSASFTQAGGVFEGSVYMNEGRGQATYYMQAGLLKGELILLDGDTWTGDDGGHRRFVQTGGSVRLSGPLYAEHMAMQLLAYGQEGSAEYILAGGSLETAGLYVAGNSRFSITNPHASLTVRQTLTMGGADTRFDIAPGTTVVHTGFGMNIGDKSNPTNFSDLSHLHLFWSPQPQYYRDFNTEWNWPGLALPSRDRGPTLDGFINNFALDTLELEDTAGTQGWLFASALPRSESAGGAFYIEHLILHEGVVLHLGDVNLYIQRLTDHGGVIHLSGDGRLILLDMLAGDMDGDGGVGTQDISLFVLALTDAAAYKAAIAHIDPVAAGDFNADGRLNTEDINPFIAALTSAAHPADGQTAAIPQPTSLALAGVLALAWTTRRRR